MDFVMVIPTTGYKIEKFIVDLEAKINYNFYYRFRDVKPEVNILNLTKAQPEPPWRSYS